MIDSVLKGTGNSRFLKSAVPAGTSWADALAMLQAGTFPIDFNGINTEGFQQVGTPLNKANLLKDATAAQIGLPPSTTPDGMFQALGNTGELHVWRKTTVTTEPVPAGYTLGDVKTKKAISASSLGSVYIGFYMGYSDSLAVDDNGGISLNLDNDYGAVTSSSDFANISSVIAGKFILIRSYQNAEYNSCSSLAGKIFYVPADANISMTKEPNYTYIRLSKCQDVTGYPLTPAGTTTTYPVSTNPKAYQEGDDAKAAGYTLGEVVTGKFAVSFYNAAEGYYYKVSENIDVSSSGSVSMPSTSENVLIDYSHNNSTTAVKNKFAGKFVQFLYRNGGDGRKFPDTKPPFNGYDIVYIPDNVSVTQEKVISNNDFVVDRYQPVTGYAAIPAGTTIEYLGKLGDKAMVQVVSYVGTGTYGSSNPNSLTFDFVPKIVMIRRGRDTKLFDAIYGMTDVTVNFSSGYCVTAEWSKKTLSWYSTDDASRQMNNIGGKYYAIAIG